MKTDKIMHSILLSAGGCSLCALIASPFSEKFARAEFFQAMIFAAVFIGILSWLFFEKKIVSHDIWVRRFLSIVCDFFVTIASMLLFGVIAPSPMRLLIGISVGLGLSFLIGIPLWCFADRIEKKNLQKINEKLKKNQ